MNRKVYMTICSITIFLNCSTQNKTILNDAILPKREYKILIRDRNYKINKRGLISIYLNKYSNKRLNGYFKELTNISKMHIGKPKYHIETYRFFYLKNGKQHGFEYYANYVNYQYFDSSNKKFKRVTPLGLSNKYKNGVCYFHKKGVKDAYESHGF